MNQDGEDFYKSGGDTVVTDSPAPAAGGQASKPPRRGSFSWTASEYIEHQRDANWYFMLVLGTAAVAAGTYWLTKELFAVATIVVVGIIVLFYARQKPRQVTYELSAEGLRIGEKLYGYGQFRSFSLIKDGVLNSVQFMPLKKLMPPISAYYDAADEERITDIIGEHLPYEDHGSDSFERFTRRLKL